MGKADIWSLRGNVLWKKGNKLHDKITKGKLPSLVIQNERKKVIMRTENKKNVELKENAEAQKKLDIAKLKGEELSTILKYDLTSTNMLYDGEIMADAKKSELLKYLQAY